MSWTSCRCRSSRAGWGRPGTTTPTAAGAGVHRTPVTAPGSARRRRRARQESRCDRTAARAYRRAVGRDLVRRPQPGPQMQDRRSSSAAGSTPGSCGSTRPLTKPPAADARQNQAGSPSVKARSTTVATYRRIGMSGYRDDCLDSHALLRGSAVADENWVPPAAGGLRAVGGLGFPGVRAAAAGWKVHPRYACRPSWPAAYGPFVAVN